MKSSSLQTIGTVTLFTEGEKLVAAVEVVVDVVAIEDATMGGDSVELNEVEAVEDSVEHTEVEGGGGKESPFLRGRGKIGRDAVPTSPLVLENLRLAQLLQQLEKQLLFVCSWRSLLVPVVS